MVVGRALYMLDCSMHAKEKESEARGGGGGVCERSEQEESVPTLTKSSLPENRGP